MAFFLHSSASNSRRRVVLSALAACVVLAACAPMAGSPGPSDADAVAAATQAWVDAYNSRDPRRITALYATDAVLWGTSSATIRTSPELVADYFKGAPNRPSARVAINEQNIRIGTDMAVNTGTYTFSDSQAGGRPDRPSRFSFVFRKREGRWQILHHHSSAMPAQ